MVHRTATDSSGLGPDEASRVLGLVPGAAAAEIQAARRRLAKQHHPDAGGDAEWMGRVNAAADRLLAGIGSAEGVPEEHVPGPPPASEPPQSRSARTGMRVDHDVASFTIEALPVEAFEALLIVTSWIGEVISDEPPYQLDVLLTDPLRCWCRLDLVPDAGASTVAVTIGTLPDEPLPDIDAVRDLWVGCLNHLGPDAGDS